MMHIMISAHLMIKNSFWEGENITMKELVSIFWIWKFGLIPVFTYVWYPVLNSYLSGYFYTKHIRVAHISLDP